MRRASAFLLAITHRFTLTVPCVPTSTAPFVAAARRYFRLRTILLSLASQYSASSTSTRAEIRAADDLLPTTCAEPVLAYAIRLVANSSKSNSSLDTFRLKARRNILAANGASKML